MKRYRNLLTSGPKKCVSVYHSFFHVCGMKSNEQKMLKWDQERKEQLMNACPELSTRITYVYSCLRKLLKRHSRNGASVI